MWSVEERPNTITFTPLDVDYNPLRMQSMPSSLYLTHPESHGDPIKYIIRPPRLRSNLRGDTYWAPWWRTTILVQSSTTLPIPCMSAHDPHIPQGYLIHALLEGITISTSYLSSTNTITPEYITAPPTLIPAPEGSYIISHLRKDTSSYLTNFVISMANPHTYAMITTIDTPVKIRLPTTINIAGSHHQQIVHIQFNPHNRNIFDRAYAGLFQNPLSQNMNS